jgi:ketosteroid isomerase-like protein
MDDVHEINVGKTELREAYNTGDVDRLLSVYAPWGFTDMSEGGPNKYGEEAKLNLRVKVTELFKEYLVQFFPIVNRVIVLGDTAYDYGWHEFILTPKSGGPPIRKRQRYFELWNRTESRDWKISLHINNEDVREELGGCSSSWFVGEERGPAPSN